MPDVFPLAQLASPCAVLKLTRGVCRCSLVVYIDRHLLHTYFELATLQWANDVPQSRISSDKPLDGLGLLDPVRPVCGEVRWPPPSVVLSSCVRDAIV